MFMKINFYYFMLLILGFFIKVKEYTQFIFIIALIYYFLLYLYETKFFFQFSWILIFNLSNIVGMFIIDNTTLYLYEIDKVSFYTGSTVDIIFINSLFTLGCYNQFKNNSFSFLYFKEKKKLKKIFFNFFIVLFLSLLITKINKFAPLLGVSRYIYRKYYISSLEDQIMRNLIFIVPLIASLFLRKKSRKKGIFLIALFILYYIAIGHKFGIISYVFYYAIFPLTIFYNKNILKRYRKKFLSILLVLFLTILIGIKTGYRYNTEQVISYFNNRISQQAQLYFSTKIKENSSEFHLVEFFNEIKSFGKIDIPPENRENIGMYKMMKLNMKKNEYEKRVYNKSVLAYAFQGLIYYYFNFIILSILFYFLGLIYSKLICYTAINALNFNIIDTIFLARLIKKFHAMLIQGEIYELISLESIFIYIFFIVKICILKKKGSKIWEKK